MERKPIRDDKLEISAPAGKPFTFKMPIRSAHVPLLLVSIVSVVALVTVPMTIGLVVWYVTHTH